MDDIDDVDKAYGAAVTEWRRENPGLEVPRSLARYFFYAGAGAGTRETKRIYDETVGDKTRQEVREKLQ